METPTRPEPEKFNPFATSTNARLRHEEEERA